MKVLESDNKLIFYTGLRFRFHLLPGSSVLVPKPVSKWFKGKIKKNLTKFDQMWLECFKGSGSGLLSQHWVGIYLITDFVLFILLLLLCLYYITQYE